MISISFKPNAYFVLGYFSTTTKNVCNPFEGRQVYEALQELQCEKCERIITVGEHNALPSPGKLPVTTGIVCRQCEPISDYSREDRGIQACLKNAI